MQVLLDTSVLIDVLRGHRPAMEYLNLLDEVPACSEITRVEIVRGMRSSERPATERLFRDTYGRPLDPDVLSDLSHRTEGWAASLQLVQSALRDRSAAQVRSFIRNLSGAHGELHDYLAEEVVGTLDEALQAFLMRTSILQAVDPVLASVVTGRSRTPDRHLTNLSASG